MKQSDCHSKISNQIVSIDSTENAENTKPAGSRIHSAVLALASTSSAISESDNFFHQCVLNLANAFQTKYALIGIYENEEKSSIRTLAVSADGKIIDNISYDLKGTPCDDCINQRTVLIQSDVAKNYPEDELLVTMELESYFGTSLLNSVGDELGVVVVLDTAPMEKGDWIYPIFNLFADRISFELERISSERDLHLAASVFEGSQEGIMLLDTEWKIKKVNNAFTKLSGWEENELLNKPISFLNDKNETDLSLQKIILELEEHGHWQEEIWVNHKSGSIYPEKRTITAVREANNNQIIHYISISTDISERKYAEQRISRLALYDQITDLPNRNYFNEKLNELITDARKNQTDLAVMTLDLDGFKLINDMRGHCTGDRLLKLIGERLQQLPSQGFFCSRMGGDEFTILYSIKNTSVHPLDLINNIAEEIIELMSLPYLLDGEETLITSSIGISLFSRDGDDAQSLIKNSDLALYKAKQLGKNRFEFYRPELSNKVESNFAITNLMRKALSKNQFELHYQSKNKAKTHEVVGYEALIRWKLDNNVLVSPGQFIPVAEDTGMIIDIGKWVLMEAFNQTQIWINEGFHFGRVAINISGRQLTDENFLSWVENLIKETDIKPTDFELEITESWLIEDPNKSANVLTKLHKLGFHLSIDDFGVAHSSLNYLKLFPVDTIKIDRSFTRDILTSDESMAIISAIIAIGNNLNLNILAEGVETEEQLIKLENAGCNEIQGFYFTKPSPAKDLINTQPSEYENNSISYLPIAK